jgi:hypothetical protein
MVAGIATIVALCSSPARSSADVQILVEELNASNTPVAQSAFQVGTPTGSSTFFQSFSYSSANGFFTLSGSVGTNSPTGSFASSLDTSFTGAFTSNFQPSQNHSLRITVTDDGFVGNGLPGILLNTAGASQGFTNGQIAVDTFSTVFNPNAPTSVPASSTTKLATGPLLGGPTPTATDIPGGANNNQETKSNISALPGSYAMQQVILVSFSQPGSTPDTSSTFGGTGGARLDPIPAPSSLALAFIGLPLLGLKRALRKRAVV